MDREHNIPDNLAECRRRLIETQRVAEETAASCESLVGEHERLQEEFATLKRMLFGPRRERVPATRHVRQQRRIADTLDAVRHRQSVGRTAGAVGRADACCSTQVIVDVDR